MTFFESPSDIAAFLAGRAVGDRFRVAVRTSAAAPTPLVFGAAETPVLALYAACGSSVGRARVGMAHVDAEGALVLTGPGMTADLVGRITRFVRANLSDHPDLALLRGLRFVETDTDGVVLDVAQPVAAWSALPASPGFFGSPIHAARVLASMVPEKAYRVWIARRDDGVRLMACPIRQDPRGERIAAASIAAGGSGVDGILRWTATGDLALTTREPVDAVAALRDAVVDALADSLPSVRVLSQARVVQAGPKDVLGMAAPHPMPSTVDARALEQTLTALAVGEAAHFWFHSTGPDGEPQLVIGGKPEVRSQARTARNTLGFTVAGRVKRFERGVLFRASEAHPGFLPALARFVGAHRDRFPGLDALAHARLQVRGDDGEPQTTTVASLWKRALR